MIYLVIGRRKRGKTTLAYYMASRCAQRVIFDPRGMLRGNAAAGVALSMSSFREGFAQLQARELDELVYTPADEDFHAAFSYFCRCCKAWIVTDAQRPLGIVIDELGFVDATDPALLWMLRCSEPECVHLVVTCHRPKDITTDMRAIADRWCIFQCRQEHDLAVLADRCAPEVADAVAALDGRAFVLWDDAIARMTAYPHAAVWYVPLSNPGHARPLRDAIDDRRARADGPAIALDAAVPVE